jgi:hypothetical protein
MSNNIDILLEQYKIYIQTAENISEKRMNTNKFYITFLSSIITIFFIILKLFKEDFNYQLIFILLSIFGITLSIIWRVNLHSYKQINRAKFKIIHKMEHNLPYRCFEKEWKLLGNGKFLTKYIKLTNIEFFLPYLYAMLFLIVLIYYLFVR